MPPENFLALSDKQRDGLFEVIIPIAQAAEKVLGAKTGAQKRRLVIAAVREAIPALDSNQVPNWIEDAAIGVAVDLVVGVLNAQGRPRARGLTVAVPKPEPASGHWAD